ncbi:MAG: hypothetical protein ACK5MK_01005 [Dysgonomonas sp.]
MSPNMILLSILALFLISIGFFAKSSLVRFCVLTPIKVWIISLLIAIALWGISTTFVTLFDWNSFYAPKGLEMFIYPLLIVSSCSCASYSIMLNVMKLVRDNWLLSLLSFFALPIIIILYFIIFPYLQSSREITLKTTFLVLFYALAFFVPQMYFYIKFRVRLKG